jgi:hypothetical protein
MKAVIANEVFAASNTHSLESIALCHWLEARYLIEAERGATTAPW